VYPVPVMGLGTWPLMDEEASGPWPVPLPTATGTWNRGSEIPGQIVPRWHVQNGRVTVPKSANDQRQRENLDIFSFCLTQDQMDAIDALGTGARPRLDSDEFGH
jgi:2,5-diketo-D-gluconate reductase A